MAANVTVCRNYNSSDYTEIASIFLNPLPQINSIEDDDSETHDWSRSGYNFLGWNTERDGSGTMKQPGEAAATPYIYFAQWQEIITTSDVVISYNNSTITSLSDSGIVVLDTAGKLVNNNITIEYTKPGGGQSGGGDFASLIQRTLTSVSDSTITTVGKCAFYTCGNLTTASFPNCTSIGTSAFAFCYSLNAISFPNCTRIDNSAFYSCSRLTTVSFPNCTSIGVSAFYYCSSLTTALFPKCTSVGNYAFCSCYSLATISFPSCTDIGTNAFSRCSRLTTVSLPNCGWLSTAAFHSCINLTTALFLKCSQIYPSAFAYCYNLLSLYLLTSTVPNLSNINAFVSTPISNYTTSTGGIYGSIFVKQSLLASFKTATYWSAYSARMVGLTDEQIAALGI